MSAEYVQDLHYGGTPEQLGLNCANPTSVTETNAREVVSRLFQEDASEASPGSKRELSEELAELRAMLIVTTSALRIAVEAIETNAAGIADLPWLKQKLERAEELLQVPA